MKEVRFSNEHPEREIEVVAGFLERPRLWIPTDDYPDFHHWLEKVRDQLFDNRKRAMVAYVEGEPVGAVVYQRHPDDPTTLQIKNVSVSPDVRSRHFGSFLLRNAEAEGAGHDFPGCEQVVVDTKMGNREMVAFLLDQHYAVERIADLYGLNTGLDVVLRKDLPPRADH